jgi:sugar phosphate isomerase/epimerase
MQMKRREFGQLMGMSALALHSLPVISSTRLFRNECGEIPKVPLGFCDHSLRAMKPNADQLIDYAVEHKLDSILLNSFRPLESREDQYLDRIKKRAGDQDISLYVGAGSISERSTRFSNAYGSAKDLLREGIRVAAKLGSPVVVCRIGTIEDRYTEGGIGAHIEAVIKLMKSLRAEALDAGVRIAFENHAGDLRSDELLALIEETGTDICAALVDFGNAIWAMEDPMNAIETLAPHIVCTSVRDVMLWKTDDGAVFQWTAVGQGLMDFPRYVETMANVCPGVPLHVESISNSPRPVPYLTPEFWTGFPDLDASEIVGFLKLLRRGHPLALQEPPEGMDQKSFDIQYQHAELEASLAYLRNNCHVGLKQTV